MQIDDDIPLSIIANGVHYKNKFFPFQVTRVTSGYPNLDCEKGTRLYIRKVWLSCANGSAGSGWNIQASTWIKNKEVTFLYFLNDYVDALAATDQLAYTHNYEFGFLTDNGKKIECTVAGYDYWNLVFEYAVITEVSDEDNLYREQKENCHILDWLQGECVKYGSIG